MELNGGGGDRVRQTSQLWSLGWEVGVKADRRQGWGWSGGRGKVSLPGCLGAKPHLQRHPPGWGWGVLSYCSSFTEESEGASWQESHSLIYSGQDRVTLQGGSKGTHPHPHPAQPTSLLIEARVLLSSLKPDLQKSKESRQEPRGTWLEKTARGRVSTRNRTTWLPSARNLAKILLVIFIFLCKSTKTERQRTLPPIATFSKMLFI